MKRLWKRILDGWFGLAPHNRRTVNALALSVVAYIAHYLVFTIVQPFYIEDAGITFAYARSLAEGHGLVPWVGGERVEGYSNPLWTFVLAFFHVLKIQVWTSSKALGALLGAATLPLAFAITRRARLGRDDLLNTLPAFLLAASSQFVIWNASGLENALFNFLLAAAALRTLQEGAGRADARGVAAGRPWSALLWFLFSITRPEAPLYAGLAFGLRCLYALGEPRGFRNVLRWLAAFLVPFVAYHLWRYHYFAWAWPETYYAKLGQGTRFKPWNWDVRGWSYFRNYLRTYGVGWASPLFVFALVGLRRWRGWVGLGLVALLGLVILWNGRAPLLDGWDAWGVVRREWTLVRLWGVYGGVILLPLVALGREGWRALWMTWSMFVTAVFFTIYSGGDWMDGFRWASLWSVPQAILLGLGLSAILERFALFQRRPVRWLPRIRSVLAVILVGALVVPNIRGSATFVARPETSVRDVYRRVQYMQMVQKRLHADHITLLDVDMGAHLWYSGWRIGDVAGLVDVPMGHHQTFPKAFVHEYVYYELVPDFIHAHGNWAKRHKILTFQEYKDGYLEIPGYPTGGKAFHMGNHVARRLFTSESYDGPPGREVRFADGLTLVGWEIPSPEVPRGSSFHLRSWWTAEDREDGFRILVFLEDARGRLASVREVSPGYDWLKPVEWRSGELVVHRHDIDLPEDLAPGAWSVGLLLLDEGTGQVIPRLAPEGSVLEAAPEGPVPIVLAQGEARLGAQVQVVTREVATQAAEEDLGTALGEAEAGRCEHAAEAWRRADLHVPRNIAWQHRSRDLVEAAVARCYAAHASAASDLYEKSRLVALGMHWDPTSPALRDVGRPVGRLLFEEGNRYREASDWEHAFRAYSAAVAADPRLSWARRRAEEARDHRLDLDGVDRPKKPPQRAPAKRRASVPVRAPGDGRTFPPPPAARRTPAPQEPLDEALLPDRR
ncbi:MAG: hypothetical protein JXB39_06870 [Deltaproteobacteria bacterium]|nr:hypothetical protein [Deltaproteobacteria bacterium]